MEKYILSSLFLGGQIIGFLSLKPRQRKKKKYGHNFAASNYSHIPFKMEVKTRRDAPEALSETNKLYRVYCLLYIAIFCVYYGFLLKVSDEKQKP